MRKTIRRGAVSVLALVACSSSHDVDHGANASGATPTPTKAPTAEPTPPPTPPPTTTPPPPATAPAAEPDLHGVSVRPEGDHTAVIDPVGGFRIDFPGTPKVETDKVGEGVHVVLSTDDAVLGFKIKRIKPEAGANVDVTKVYKATVSAFAKSGFEVREQRVITMAGVPALAYTGTKEIQGTRITMRDWMIEVPATATLYQVVITGPTGWTPPEAWQRAVDSFRAAK